MTNNQDDRSTVIELVGRARTGMLTTLTAEDDHVSRPMGGVDEPIGAAPMLRNPSGS